MFLILISDTIIINNVENAPTRRFVQVVHFLMSLRHVSFGLYGSTGSVLDYSPFLIETSQNSYGTYIDET